MKNLSQTRLTAERLHIIILHGVIHVIRRRSFETGDDHYTTTPPSFPANVRRGDGSTGKWSLLGVFNRISIRNFPGKHEKLVVYLAVTEINGHYPFEIRIVDSDESTPPVFQGPGKLIGENPLDVLETALELRNVIFRAPGEYRLQVVAGNTIIGERKFFVNSLPRVPTHGPTG